MYLETADLLLYIYAVPILLVDSKIERARIKDARCAEVELMAR